MKWLGTAGWQVTAGETSVLVDPYLSRFPTGLAAGRFDPTTPLQVDEQAVLDGVGAAPQLVLVTHTHWDHAADVPHIARRWDCRVVGTMTTARVAEAMDVPPSQLLVVKGGEQLDFGDVIVRVVPSLHSRSGTGGLLFAGTRTEVPRRPQTISDLPEGDTLSFVVSRPHGPRVYFAGASDVDDQVLTGLDVDVAAVPVPANDMIDAYVPRLLEALGRPRLVLPVHWDDFESAPTHPPTVSADGRARLEAMIREVKRASPQSTVVVPDYRTAIDVF